MRLGGVPQFRGTFKGGCSTFKGGYRGTRFRGTFEGGYSGYIGLDKQLKPLTLSRGGYKGNIQGYISGLGFKVLGIWGVSGGGWPLVTCE